MLRRGVGHRIERWLAHARLGTPGQASPSVVRFFERFVAPMVRLAHRPTFEGTEQLPEGPYLLIANHSAGLGIAEIETIIVSWLARFGTSRPLAGMAHVFSFVAFPISRVLVGLGAIPSTRAHVEAALRGGVPVLAFPGGDHEALRPLWQANRVDLAGRKGLLRIARGLQVPIVPMGIRGSHFTAPILFRVPRVLAPLLVFPVVFGGNRWSISLLAALSIAAVLVFGHAWPWPVQAIVCWVIAGSPLMFQPWIPARIRIRIGRPLFPATLFPVGDGEPELDAAYQRVTAEVQALVDGTG